MNFLGRQNSGECNVTATGVEQSRHVFAGVVAFCVPNGHEYESVQQISSSLQVQRKTLKDHRRMILCCHSACMSSKS